ncbi:MAG TPA: BON domain-containing protein, partial [Steroidobacteraceae bacterium]
LKWWPSIDAAHIGVTAQDGVVSLTGQVANYSEKLAAEDSTKTVYGVKGIANDIQVVVAPSNKPTDQDIAQAVLDALKWDYEVPADKITVTVKQGWVTLEGSVDWQYEKDAAARAVRYLNGVSSLSNLINVKPKAKWVDVKNEIVDAFRRKADLDARRIDVLTDAGKVTLYGSVSSWSERDQAVDAAWAAPGVTSVKDGLTVVP